MNSYDFTPSEKTISVKNESFLMAFIIKTLSTFFFIGYLPFIPGTFGSIVGVGLFFLIRANRFSYAVLTFTFMLLGFLVTGKAERIFNRKDTPCIVIDEITGMLLSLIFIPYNLKLIIAGFILFRLLDALKPYPAVRLHNLRGSLGIMSDDIVAGIYTSVILQILLRITSSSVS